MRASDFPFFDATFLAFAHRGGATYGPNVGRENTLGAFTRAVELGYRYLETDVHASADGELVAFHDDRLDRVTSAHGMIADLTWSDLRRVRVRSAGESSSDDDSGAEIPRFVDLLRAFPQARFNVDAKSEASVDLLARAIRDEDAYERVCVSSFSPARLHRLRRLLPGVASAATTRGVAWMRFGSLFARLLATPAPALQLPVRHHIAGRPVQVLTAGLVARAHRAGKQVHVWTVDDQAEMHRLIDLGVDGIFTDRVDTLKSVLLGRGLWTES